MTTTMRVRELSAELGITNKDLISMLRKLNISVRSHMSGLTDADVQKVRDQLAHRESQPKVVERKVGSGVIVRHRRKKPKPVKDEPQVQPAEENNVPVPETPAAESTEKQSPKQVNAVIIKEEDEKADKPQDTDPIKKDEKPEVEASSQFEPKAEPEAKPEPESDPEKSTPVVSADDDAAKKTAPAANAANAVDKSATDSAPGTDAPKEKKKRKRGKKKKSVAVVQPQVKIISMPEPGQKPAPATETAPRQKTFRSPAAPSADQGRRKKKKGRRMVDATHFYGKDGAPLNKLKKGDPRRGKDKRRDAAANKPSTQPIKASKKKIRIDESIRLADLAQQMGVKAQDLIKVLLGMGVMATINQSVDVETAELVASEFGYGIESVGFSEDDYLIPKEPDKPEDLKPRPPVVTIMGHVDHGKTSLLDAIRKSSVTTGEAGGITQHIGAYHVKTHRGEIVFLDTPGHEAFTAMRVRGAEVTDLVILVVAADDGVMDQTREALSHSKAAGVPILVAVNKIDKEGANPDRVKRELADLGLVPEDWGGDTIFCNVSAKAQTGLDELLELVLLQAEVLELSANPDKPGRGHIVEARLDKGRGAVATVLIQEGQINQGDAFACGLFSGKVRALFNDQGRKIKGAGPAIPVEVQGFEGVPEAGDEFVVVSDEKVARKIAEARQHKQREKALSKESKLTLDKFLAAKADEEVKHLKLVVKSDVQGSLEAIAESLQKLSTDEVKVEIIHGGAGAITDTDILLASASSAIIIGFNIRPTAKVKETAERENVEIRFYDIIYKLVNEIRDAMTGMLDPEIKEVYLGQAEVRQTFSVPKIGTIAGCSVVDGKLVRNARIRLLRDGVVLYTGKLSSLKRFKDDVKEVGKGFECGAGLERYNDLKEGDVIEAFDEVHEERTEL